MLIFKCETEMTVGEAPVGLFQLECGEIICISEYRSASSRDAYIVSSGENYCGDGDKAKGHPLVISW